jgi:hypothetical protein
VDPVPDPLLLRKSGSTGNRTLRNPGSINTAQSYNLTKIFNGNLGPKMYVIILGDDPNLQYNEAQFINSPLQVTLL